jgi:hypothetical protein
MGWNRASLVTLPPGKVKLRVRARAISQEPYEVLEILVNGKVVRSAKPAAGEAVIDEAIEVDRGGWIAARAHGRTMLPYGATWWMMPVFAHTSPVYLEMAGRPAECAGIGGRTAGAIELYGAVGGGAGEFPHAGE